MITKLIYIAGGLVGFLIIFIISIMINRNINKLRLKKNETKT